MNHLVGPGVVGILVAIAIWLALMAGLWALIRSGTGAALRRWS